MEYKNYEDAVNSKEVFFQVAYYDRTEDYTSSTTIRNFSNKGEAENLIEQLKEENEKLFQTMLDVYGQYGITEDNYKDCYEWNRVQDEVDRRNLSKSNSLLFRYSPDNVGYSFIKLYERDLEQERKEEEEALDAMEEQDYGPYGGAFRDTDDYYSWKEGAAFFR